MKKLHAGMLVSVVGLVMAAGCDRANRGATTTSERTTPVASEQGTETARVGESRSSGPTVASRQPTAEQAEASATDAVNSISAARCDREVRCGNVGPDATFDSRDQCVMEIRREWAAELSAYDCPGGIVRDELVECLHEIRNEDCGNPFDTLGRVVACRSSDICDVN